MLLLLFHLRLWPFRSDDNVVVIILFVFLLALRFLRYCVSDTLVVLRDLKQRC
jgi:hypothetical protein